MQLVLSTIEIQVHVRIRGRLPNARPGPWATIRAWMQRRTQRQALAGLDEHLLRDIGISRADASQEAAKPFWKI